MRDMQYIDVLSLAKLLGKSPRRIQELAKEGKIPARKVGPVWQFNKQEIDQWLSVKGIPPLQCGHNVDISTGPSQGEDVASRDQQEEGSAIKGVPGAGKKKATAPNV